MARIRVPWFLGAPAVAGSALVIALALNYLLSDYFIRTFIDEADPLAGLPVAADKPESAGGAPMATVGAPAAAVTPTAPAPAAAVSTPAATNTSPAAAQATATTRPEVAGSTAAAQPTSPPSTATPTPTTAPPPPAPTATPVPSAPAPGVISQGAFRDGEPGHTGSGTARIVRDAEGQLFLRFENFSVTNGPDLRVYLSTTDGYGGSPLELGKLKATDGNQNYAIPAGVDVSAFRSALIWCEPFRVLFAIAALEETP